MQYLNPLDETARFSKGSMKTAPCANICIGCGNQPDTWPSYRNGLPDAASFEHVAVFKSSTNGATAGSATTAPPASCVFGFTKGWYGEERTPTGYLFWLNGNGKISLLAPADGKYSLTARLLSVTRPNTIKLLLDGKNFQRYSVTVAEGLKFRTPDIPLAKPVRFIILDSPQRQIACEDPFLENKSPLR